MIIAAAGALAAPAYAEIKFEILPMAEKELKLAATTRAYRVEFEPPAGIAKIECSTAAIGKSNIKGAKIPGKAEELLKLSGCKGTYAGLACTSAEIVLASWEGEVVEVTAPKEYQGDAAILMKAKEKGGFGKLVLTNCGALGSVSETVAGSIPLVVEPSGMEAIKVALKIVLRVLAIKTHEKVTEEPKLEVFGKNLFMEGASEFEIPEKLFWGVK